jgi:hypothetical protein
MDNMHIEAINSGVTGEKTLYSHAVTIFGIPIMYIVLSILLILVVLYLFCRMKKKNCHHFSVMKKSSYITLFITCAFVMSFINFHYSSWEVAPDLLFIIIIILFSLVESLIPYLVIILSIHTINCYRKSS